MPKIPSMVGSMSTIAMVRLLKTSSTPSAVGTCSSSTNKSGALIWPPMPPMRLRTDRLVAQIAVAVGVQAQVECHPAGHQTQLGPRIQHEATCLANALVADGDRQRWQIDPGGQRTVTLRLEMKRRDRDRESPRAVAGSSSEKVVSRKSKSSSPSRISKMSIGSPSPLHPGCSG